MPYLVTLDDGLPEVANLASYIRIVKDAALLRETMFACQSIIDRCAAASDPTNEVLDDAAAILERVRNKGQSKHGRWLTPWDVIRNGGDSVLFPSHGSSRFVGSALASLFSEVLLRAEPADCRHPLDILRGDLEQRYQTFSPDIEPERIDGFTPRS